MGEKANTHTLTLSHTHTHTHARAAACTHTRASSLVWYIDARLLLLFSNIYLLLLEAWLTKAKSNPPHARIVLKPSIEHTHTRIHCSYHSYSSFVALIIFFFRFSIIIWIIYLRSRRYDLFDWQMISHTKRYPLMMTQLSQIPCTSTRVCPRQVEIWIQHGAQWRIGLIYFGLLLLSPMMRNKW